ncbi:MULTISPECIES: PRD domain-containing protein [Breznakia]|uniref:BglG family transcriptional antiterminator n=1 Tax=Breznakia blatticola TaxID=1754012 RepID=A0A4R7ZFE4_9FIRM|nr:MULTISPECIES: PRD domain-containing protein [Breznakia]MDH6365924.1 transcriptional antiterminator [Breznakia sp. PH1-1]MDH6403144.1 transcriptional antiterminator [Breznakia sp. PF1-11]MDH6410853.1 transcriptional antiterminator [Breznakia sp. PFB1-11]MDH6413090.1 transcriptional antiterminator [Breznakia sp. PFB1-14]MDH6415458.1 transcriptional antiterminator [Breznakia sp. PFB1-4]
MQQTTKNYKVKKVLNNSSLIVHDRFREYVIIQKGIGFGIKADMQIKKGTPYERMYSSPLGSNQFSNVVNGFNDEIISIVMDTVQLIVAYEENGVNHTTFVTLANHLAATYTRILNGEAIKQFFSYEIKALYPESYDKAQKISQAIYRKHELMIPDAEVSYIALHIQNIQSGEKSIDLLNAIISEVYDLLTITYKFDIKNDDLNYLRFITHLRFLVEGTEQEKRQLNEHVNDALVKSYPEYTGICDDILQIIEDLTGVKLAKQERVYILIHLVNMLEGKARQ